MELKINLFREISLFSREDILTSLEETIDHEKTDRESDYSINVRINRIKLLNKFYKAIKKCKLPVLTELWWYYDYQFLGDRIELDLCHAEEVEIESDGLWTLRSIVDRCVMTIECDYLTVEQFATMHSVEPDTVMKWIRCGKLRHAKKVNHEWFIPSIEEKPSRGFDIVHYDVINESKITSDEFPMLATADSIVIMQDQNQKSKFTCYLKNFKTKFRTELELTRQEVQRLEYIIIESGKAKVI